MAARPGFRALAFAASLTLAVMTLPVVIVSTKESLQAVPQAYREACWALGATRWQTIRTVVLPNSVSGILTGVILEVSRTAGETAPIMFTGAAFFLPFLPHSVFEQTMALSLHLFVVSTMVPGVPDNLPYGVALELALTGDPISAERGYELGLVNRIAEPGTAVDVALELAGAIARNGPLAIAATKTILEQQWGWSDEEFWAKQGAISGPVFGSQDAREGAIAFTEKRDPVWQGR